MRPTGYFYSEAVKLGSLGPVELSLGMLIPRHKGKDRLKDGLKM